MKCRLLIVSILGVFFVSPAVAQPVAPVQNSQAASALRSSDPVENISNDLARTARAVEALSRSWAEFMKNFSSNQGLQMEERERKLILALEVLNRFEVSHSNLLKLKLDLVERQNRAGRQLATVADNLLPQSIDRFVALRGTTDAENIREIRRNALSKEQRELTQLLSQINRELYTAETDVLRFEQQIKTLRSQIFGEAARQLADF